MANNNVTSLPEFLTEKDCQDLLQYRKNLVRIAHEKHTLLQMQMNQVMNDLYHIISHYFTFEHLVFLITKIDSKITIPNHLLEEVKNFDQQIIQFYQSKKSQKSVKYDMMSKKI